MAESGSLGHLMSSLLLLLHLLDCFDNFSIVIHANNVLDDDDMMMMTTMMTTHFMTLQDIRISFHFGNKNANGKYSRALPAYCKSNKKPARAVIKVANMFPRHKVAHAAYVC